MTLTIYQVDAFSDHLFGGNPAAVCPLQTWLDPSLMQQIATENNLAETAFFVPDEKGFALRWFTPAMEVDLCGHATLATAHVLFQHLGFSGEQIAFQTRSGTLKVDRKEGGYEMDFPSQPPVASGVPAALVSALGVEALYVGQSTNYYFVTVADQQTVLATQPDMRALKKLEKIGVIVSAPGEEADFVSRFFAPKAGIDEDPVTGSAHAALIPYWGTKLNKTHLWALQLSPRQGELFCEWQGERVKIGGKAVTYLIGEIQL